VFLIVAGTAGARSVSAQDGRIYLTGQTGTKPAITDSGLDYNPSLSFDNRQIVFVRRTPGHTVMSGSGESDYNELWIADVDGNKTPRRVLEGGGSIDGPNVALGAFGGPEFSPDSKSVYFGVAAYATGGIAMKLDLATARTKFLGFGGVDVIRTGKYKGFLIGAEYTIVHGGRATVYRLLNADGALVMRIGDNESALNRFKQSHGIR